jgi:hypothetical protein
LESSARAAWEVFRARDLRLDREVAVKNARHKKRIKHGGEWQRLNLDESCLVEASPANGLEVLANVDGVEGFRCDCVKLMPFAKGYGTYPTYVVRRCPGQGW